ncbi:MAG TPA: FecR domain-containing protein, partial [Mucilaginibacter sp.]|nr:FecR domain-containing protein [Mucilaginibacter sp.]
NLNTLSMDKEPELSAINVAAFITSLIEGTTTLSDEQKLQVWKEQSTANQQLFDELLDQLSRDRHLGSMYQFDAEAAFNRFNERAERHTVLSASTATGIRRKLYKRILAAASVLILLSTGLILYHYHAKQSPITTANNNDIAPGKNKAVLVLSNGQKINLDDTNKGLIAQQSGVRISKSNQSQLTYQVLDEKTTALEYNTIVTPYGGSYKVILPDGTQVWLNAASSIRFPTRFRGRERQVTLTGEGYFEVVHNSKMPFIVKSPDQEIKVLGTHFNIHDYHGEPVITTLVKGSVKVILPDKKSAILKPGYMSTYQFNQLNIRQADIGVNLAWKEEQFIFHNTSLVDIMREVQRWYNVEVDFNSLPPSRFNGAMSRNVPLSELLQMLEITSKLKFKITGRRIMVER